MNSIIKKSVVSVAKKKRGVMWKYPAIRSALNTFDIINCEHEKLFWRMVGHTAVIYRDVVTGMLFVYESTTLNKFSGISGVQLTPMRLWVDKYPGKVKVRRAFRDGMPLCWDALTPYSFGSRCQRLAQGHIAKYRGVPYPDLKDPEQREFVLNSAIDLPFGIGENVDRDDIFFCTHLVADFWQTSRLYVGDEPTSEWQPDDTRPGGEFEKRLAKGVCLGPEIDLN